MSRKLLFNISTIFILLLPVSVAHQIIFEEIGSLAGALHYHHVHLELKLETLEIIGSRMYQILDHHQNLTQTALPLRAGFNRTEIQHLGYASGQTVADAIEQYTLKGHLDVNDIIRSSVDQYVDRLQALKGLFPVTASSEADRILARDDFDEPLQQFVDKSRTALPRHSRSKRFIWGLLSSVTGTFMGLYNRQQLTALRESLTDLKTRQDGLIKVSKAHAVLIHQLENSLDAITKSTLIMAANPAAVTSAKLQQMIDIANRSIDKAIRAVQAAQNRRLSADFLDPDQLSALFDKLSAYADEHQKKLLIEHPSDLLQVELSYFFSGSDITMLLHVPMAPANAMLRLMRHRPFPIPLDDSTGLMPALDRDVLAISDASALEGKRLTMEVKFTDLMECHQINSVYLCEKHGVLNFQSNTSCLAALYGQDHDAALNLCTMNVVDLDEAVLPLGDNNFLVYNDQAGYNAELQCLKVPVQDFTLKKGINTVHLPEHCSLRLRTSMVFADSSVHLKTDFHTYEWDWDRSFSHSHTFKDPRFVSDLHSLAVSQIGSLNLIDVFRTATARENTNNMWTNFYISVGFIGLLSLFVFLIVSYQTFHHVRLSAILRHLAAAVAPRLQPFLDRLPASVRSLVNHGNNLQLPFVAPTPPPPQPDTVSI